MTRRGDHEIGGWWAFVSVLFALTGVVLFVIAEADHSYRLMQWAAVAWIAAFTFMFAAMPPRWD